MTPNRDIKALICAALNQPCLLTGVSGTHTFRKSCRPGRAHSAGGKRLLNSAAESTSACLYQLSITTGLADTL